MTLTIDPNPNDRGNVAECRRRVQSLRESLDRLDGILADVRELEGRGEHVLPTLFTATALVRLARLDRRLADLADESAALACEELYLMSNAGPAAAPAAGEGGQE